LSCAATRSTDATYPAIDSKADTIHTIFLPLSLPSSISTLYSALSPSLPSFPSFPPSLPSFPPFPPSLPQPTPTTDPMALPVPQHVSLNHLYCTAIKDGMMVLGATQRYKEKFFTVVFYSVMPGSGGSH
jgi:5'-AMP-activated protein kinase beta subunit, interaction domain